jgi:hypothetical protein
LNNPTSRAVAKNLFFACIDRFMLKPFSTIGM